MNTSLGLVPAQIAPFLVERLGYSEAKRLAVTGGRLGAQEALALRLVHKVCDSAQLEQVLASVLSDIALCAPQAIAATKALIGKARYAPASALGAFPKRKTASSRRCARSVIQGFFNARAGAKT